MSTALALSPHRVISLSPHGVKGLHGGIAKAIQYRLCTCHKTIVGLNGYAGPDGLDTPCDYFGKRVKKYKSREDIWTFYNGYYPVYLEYTGGMSLVGAGDCPQASGYPEMGPWGALNGPPTPSLIYPGTSGYWTQVLDYLSPPSNYQFGIQVENFPPTTHTDTNKIFTNISSGGMVTESLEENLGEAQDDVQKYTDAYDVFIGESFSGDWSTTGNIFNHPQWHMLFNEWGEYYTRDGVDSLTLIPANYDASATVQNGAEYAPGPVTPNDWKELASGWAISDDAADVLGIAMQRCQVRIQSNVPIVCTISRWRRSFSFSLTGFAYLRMISSIWGGPYWIWSVDVIDSVTLVPNSDGKIVYEIPYPPNDATDRPFPLGCEQGMPVMETYYVLSVPGIDLGYKPEFAEVFYTP